MGEKKEFHIEDFTDVTNFIDMALDRMNTIFNSLELTEEQKSELRKLGISLHNTAHEIGHFFLALEPLPDKLKEALHQHYEH